MTMIGSASFQLGSFFWNAGSDTLQDFLPSNTSLRNPTHLERITYSERSTENIIVFSWLVFLSENTLHQPLIYW
jgi:hypothetical protein